MKLTPGLYPASVLIEPLEILVALNLRLDFRIIEYVTVTGLLSWVSRMNMLN